MFAKYSNFILCGMVRQISHKIACVLPLDMSICISMKSKKQEFLEHSYSRSRHGSQRDKQIKSMRRSISIPKVGHKFWGE